MESEREYVAPPLAPVEDREPAPASPNGAAYEFEIDLDSDSTHARVVGLIGRDKRVLELGPATGYMSRVLVERGCSVVAIERDPEMAARAAASCERMVVGDLDELDLESELSGERFDVIVAADVLEHLKDPLRALNRLRPFLGEGGYFVVSVPNVAHGSVRLALLEGRFPYQRRGLLDQTHLRFFTRESLDELMDEAELAVVEVHRQQLDVTASEVPFDPAGVPPEVLEQIERDPEARTYQFVLKAVALAAPGLRELQRRIRELAHENAKLREAEPELRRLTESREGALRSALIDTHDQLLRRDEELSKLTTEIGKLKGEIADERERRLRLQIRLDRILQSPPARAWEALRGLPGVSHLVARRQAGYEAALRSAKDTPSPPS